MDKIDINVNIDSLKILEEENYKIDSIKFQKMLLIYNAIEEGWCIKRKNKSYIFTKNHENKKEVLDDNYLLKFMKMNLDLNKVFS